MINSFRNWADESRDLKRESEYFVKYVRDDFTLAM